MHLSLQAELELHIQLCVHDSRAKLQGDISSTFSSDSEAFASELLENIEEMFPWYYMYNDILS